MSILKTPSLSHSKNHNEEVIRKRQGKRKKQMLKHLYPTQIVADEKHTHYFELSTRMLVKLPK